MSDQHDAKNAKTRAAGFFLRSIAAVIVLLFVRTHKREFDETRTKGTNGVDGTCSTTARGSKWKSARAVLGPSNGRATRVLVRFFGGDGKPAQQPFSSEYPRRQFELLVLRIAARPAGLRFFFTGPPQHLEETRRVAVFWLAVYDALQVGTCCICCGFPGQRCVYFGC